MPSEIASSRNFIKGAGSNQDIDTIYLITKAKGLEEAAYSNIISVWNRDWADVFTQMWDSTAMAVAQKPKRRMILVGQEGEVAVYLGFGKETKEKIKPKPSVIRNAKDIEGYVYACGMKRQVFKREGEKKWKDISAPWKKGEEVGFEAIDGFSQKEIYAVGWKGEIWKYDGKKWEQQNSPVKAILTAVHCAPDGYVYAVGQNGIVIRGRGNKWQVVKQKQANEDLWDVNSFKKKIYVSGYMGVYTLEKDELVKVNFGKIKPKTFYGLATCKDLIYSIGQDDVIWFDGKKWGKID